MEIKVIHYPKEGKFKPVFKSPKAAQWGFFYEVTDKGKTQIEFDDLDSAIKFCVGQEAKSIERQNARTVWRNKI